MKKRAFSLALALLLALSLLPTALAAAPQVVLSPQKLSVNDWVTACEKYNIDGANYFKLRDIAKLLSGTANQFEVGFDGKTNTVTVNTGKPYTAVGGELNAGQDKSSTAVKSSQKLKINGREVEGLSVYNIGGANFFKLRDLGSQLGFLVDFDAKTNTAQVFSKDYERVKAAFVTPKMSSDAMKAYLAVLGENREAILGYDWQMGQIYDEDRYELVPVATAAPVTFADVWGDGEPELLFLTAESYEGFRIVATLHVYTFENGRARELLKEGGLDGQAGGGGGYRLFQLDGDKSLWLYVVYFGEGENCTYTRYTASGEMTPALTLARSEWLADDEDNEGAHIEYELAKDDKPCTDAEYDAAVPSVDEQAKGLLMRNYTYWEYTDLEPGKAFSFPLNPALTYDAAVAYLRGALGVTPAAVNEKQFFASLPDFEFASGVGGWDTTLNIASDGTFDGFFHDSDMGDSGPGYPNGTIYVCTFSGKFGKVKRVDDYTYSMHVLELNVEPTPDKEWIEDDVRWVASAPYGLENADEVLVYLPGAWMQALPYDFVSWVEMPHAWGSSERPVLLPCYGLYNVADKEGFSSWGQHQVYVGWADELLSSFTQLDEFTASSAEPASKFLIAATETVTDVRFNKLTLKSIDDFGQVDFTEELLHKQAKLTPECPLEITGTFIGDTPNYGISFRTADGETHRCAIDVSGKDGSLYLFEF